MVERDTMQMLYWKLVHHNVPSTKARKLAKAIDSLNTYEFNSLVKVLKPLNESIL